MQLILGAAILGVDRQRQRAIGDRRAALCRQLRTRLPGEGEEIRRRGIEQRRAFHAADFRQRDQQILQRPVQIFEQRIALLRLDALARRGLAGCALIRLALFTDDVPQRIAVFVQVECGNR